MEKKNIQQPLDLTRALRALGYTHPNDLDGASVIAIRTNGEIVHDYLQGVTNARTSSHMAIARQQRAHHGKHTHNKRVANHAG